MANTLDEFNTKLKSSPALRHQVLADTISVLQKHGVNVDDPAVVAALGLNNPLHAGGVNPVASSVIITITA